MQKVLSRENISELSQAENEICISIYFKTQPGIAKKNIQIFKSSLKQAQKILKTSDFKLTKINEILEPTNTLKEDTDFWNDQLQSFACFIDNSHFNYFKVNVDFNREVIVSDRFYLKPLIKALHYNQPYRVLALNKKDTKIFKGTLHSLDESKINGMPVSLEEILQNFDQQKQLQYHTKTKNSVGSRPAVHHGQGDFENTEKEAVKLFLNRINNKLNPILKEENVPLILAGTEGLIEHYKSINTYKNLLPEAIKMTVEDLTDNELHSMSLEIIKSILNDHLNKKLENFKQQRSDGNTSTNVNEVINASHQGKVSLLFVENDKKVWGAYNPSTGFVYLHDEYKQESVDLTDLAAVKVLQRHTEVYILDSESMPSDTGVAAVLY